MPDRKGAYALPCGWCGVKAGQFCQDSHGLSLRSGYTHEERVVATRRHDLDRLREHVELTTTASGD